MPAKTAYKGWIQTRKEATLVGNDKVLGVGLDRPIGAYSETEFA